MKTPTQYGSENEETSFIRRIAAPDRAHGKRKQKKRIALVGATVGLVAASAVVGYAALRQGSMSEATLPTQKLEAERQQVAQYVTPLDDTYYPTFDQLDANKNKILEQNEYLYWLEAKMKSDVAKVEDAELPQEIKDNLISQIKANYESDGNCYRRAFKRIKSNKVTVTSKNIITLYHALDLNCPTNPVEVSEELLNKYRTPAPTTPETTQPYVPETTQPYVPATTQPYEPETTQPVPYPGPEPETTQPVPYPGPEPETTQPVPYPGPEPETTQPVPYPGPEPETTQPVPYPGPEPETTQPVPYPGPEPETTQPVPYPGPEPETTQPVPYPGPEPETTQPVPYPGPELETTQPVPYPGPEPETTQPVPYPGPEPETTRPVPYPGPEPETTQPVPYPGPEPETTQPVPYPGPEPETTQPVPYPGPEPETTQPVPYPGPEPETTQPVPYPGPEPETTQPVPYPGPEPETTQPVPYPGPEPGTTQPLPYPGPEPETTQPVPYPGPEPETTQPVPYPGPYPETTQPSTREPWNPTEPTVEPSPFNPVTVAPTGGDHTVDIINDLGGYDDDDEETPEPKKEWMTKEQFRQKLSDYFQEQAKQLQDTAEKAKAEYEALLAKIKRLDDCIFQASNKFGWYGVYEQPPHFVDAVSWVANVCMKENN
ncbi:hypothetical protein Poli38472_002900 [Pythium oligandrum]|uniref:Uncharacterized protein n=1 Tax=Pythium oligandrum TaxID=41045 RepID=A0A8K1C600_PYTOL|nr:hypothetical protein Poli38472_002900 [Pythium oligandrum]|eukprot:TMW56975.1 hypothetical protein Poli38472_002900 [Pythium oligandrum]